MLSCFVVSRCMEKTRAYVVVSGRVQGVCFRDATRKAARQARVLGWVRNLRDSRVEAVLEGDKDAVAKVVAFMRRGPEFAVVDDIEIKYEEPVGEFVSFDIRLDA